MEKGKAELHLKDGVKKVIIPPSLQDDAPIHVTGVNRGVQGHGHRGLRRQLHYELPTATAEGRAREARHRRSPDDLLMAYAGECREHPNLLEEYINFGHVSRF